MGAFLFALVLVIGGRFAENAPTPTARRLTYAGTVLVAVLLGAFVSLGISELYRRSSGAPILSPIFGFFYAFIIGKYTTVGFIIAAQTVGSLLGFLLGRLLRPRLRHAFEQTKEDNTVRGFLWRSIAVIVLLVCVAVVSLINPTAYGGTFVLKIIVMALLFTSFAAIFGRVEFYSYTSLYALIPMFVSVRFSMTTSRIRTDAAHARAYHRGPFALYVCRPGIRTLGVMGLLANRHFQALVLQFAALGILIGIYRLVQLFPGAVAISNVI